MGEETERVRMGTAEREQAIERTRDWRAYVMAFVPLIALACTMLVPHGWLAWLALPVAGMLLYGRRG